MMSGSMQQQNQGDMSSWQPAGAPGPWASNNDGSMDNTQQWMVRSMPLSETIETRHHHYHLHPHLVINQTTSLYFS